MNPISLVGFTHILCFACAASTSSAPIVNRNLSLCVNFPRHVPSATNWSRPIARRPFHHVFAHVVHPFLVQSQRVRRVRAPQHRSMFFPTNWNSFASTCSSSDSSSGRMARARGANRARTDARRARGDRDAAFRALDARGSATGRRRARGEARNAATGGGGATGTRRDSRPGRRTAPRDARKSAPSARERAKEARRPSRARARARGRDARRREREGATPREASTTMASVGGSAGAFARDSTATRDDDERESRDERCARRDARAMRRLTDEWRRSQAGESPRARA
jgi:hypothetical protein